MRSLLLIILLIGPFISTAAQDDGIPANCPYSGGVFFNRNWFVRTEPGRTAVVDWSTGAEVRLLTDQRTGADIAVGRWSPECQYVSVAYGMPDDRGVTIYTSVVYDLVNGGEIAVFEGARMIPYPLTWDTNSTRLLVETRFGAYIHYLGGGDVWLTSEADGNSRAFRPGTVRWDYAANQIVGVLSIPPFGSAAYDMSSGALVGLTDQFNRPRELSSSGYLVQAPVERSNYPCVTTNYRVYTYGTRVVEYRENVRSFMQNARVILEPETKRILLIDAGTSDVLRVLAYEFEFESNSSFGGDFRPRWSPGCRYLVVSAYRDEDLRVIDPVDGRIVFDLSGFEVRQFEIDPSNRFAAYTTRLGGFVVNLDTAESFRTFEFLKVQTIGWTRSWTYESVTWDLASGLVEFDFGFEFRVYRLETGELISVRRSDGQPVSEAELDLKRRRIASPFGCEYRIRYHATDRALVVQDPLLRETIAVIEREVVFDRYAFRGQSPDCRYVTVDVIEGGIEKRIVYDLLEMKRTELSATDGLSSH
ncbi:MAG: hypothetical protein IPM16_03395 [Chloroflexi bacterium]|nr:hypothetical protein [Chloroflexota bacterium]